VTISSQDHPECQSGEMFLTNCGSEKEFETIGYQHKRLGTIAYKDNGEIAPNDRPVFVWQVEYNLRHHETKIGQ
jgi:hypothetical protein